MERLTRPLRYPKRVPVMRAPLLSGRRPLGREGRRQAVGVIMGKERKTVRKTRKTLPDLVFFLVEGCTRVRVFCGGGGGGDVDAGDVSPIAGSATAGRRVLFMRLTINAGFV